MVRFVIIYFVVFNQNNIHFSFHSISTNLKSEDNSEFDSLLELTLDEEEIKLMLESQINNHSIMDLFLLQETNVQNLSSHQFVIDP